MRRTGGSGRRRLLSGAIFAALLASAAESAPPPEPPPGFAGAIRSDGPVTVRIPSAALILSGQSGGSLRLSLLAMPVPAGRGSYEVALLTEIPGENFGEVFGEASSGGRHGFDVIVYGLGPDGEVAARETQGFSIDLASRRETLAERGLQILSGLRLQARQYALRVLVRSRESDAFGLAGLVVDLPPPGAGPALLAPRILEPFDPARIVLPPAGSELPEDALAPILVEGRPHFPTARPVLASGSPALASLVVLRPGDRSAPIEAPLEALLESRADGAGKTRAAELGVEILARSPAGEAETEASLVEVRVPPLPPGRYALRFSLGGGEPRTALSAETAVVLLPPSAEAPPGAEARAGAESAAAGGRPPGRAGRSARRQILAGLEEDYRAALLLLAGGDRPASLAALRGLEIGARRALSPVDFRLLVVAEERTLEGLTAAGTWSGLVPVFELHADLREEYGALRENPLEEHALRMSLRLARELARGARSRTAGRDRRGEAARALATVAWHLQRSGRLEESGPLFEEACELDAENRAAVLGLAYQHELRERYGEAAALLAGYLEHRPEHEEARLRLAVNLRRAGEIERATGLLGALVAGRAEEWIAVVAAQELARIAIDAGEYGRAVETLRAAAERWPERPLLRVQLAYALDRLSGPRAAGEAIGALGSPAVPGPRAARYRYNRWSIPEPERAPAPVDGVAEERLAELSRALGRRPEGAER